MQLLYLHKLLQKENNHWTLASLYALRDRNTGWAKQIIEILNAWDLEDDWELIKSKRATTWKKEVLKGAEEKNKQQILDDCMTKKRGVEIIKTKVKTIVPLIQSDMYVRKPQPFMRENNKLIAKAYIMGRYGMLQCAANFSNGYARKECRNCGALDDENHRINHCSVWSKINLSTVDRNVEYQDIYSDDRKKSLKVVEKIMEMWDLGNDINAMKT